MNKRNLVIGLFAIAVIAQLAVPGWLLARHENVIRNGELYKFRCEPVDPVDLLRGRYVALGFSDMKADGVPGLIPGTNDLYATFDAGDDGFARLAALHGEPPADRPYLKIDRFDWREAAHISVVLDLPFDRFYMDEKLAPEVEQAMRRRGNERLEAYLEVRILDGRAAPVELYIDGKPASEF